MAGRFAEAWQGAPEAAAGLCLRVLAGPNRGAEVALAPGRYRVGRGLDCDIVLGDPQVAEAQLVLDVGPWGVAVEPLARPLWLDGQAVRQKPFRIEPFQCLTLGQTCLALGPDDRPWPALEPPTPQAEAAPGAAAPARATRRWRRPAWLGERWVVRAAAGLYLVALVLLSQGISLPVGARLDEDAVARQVRIVLDQLGLGSQVQVVQTEEGRPRVEGYVPDARARNRLLQSLHHAGLDVTARIWSMADLVRQATEVMHSLGVDHVRARAGRRGGELVMQGYVADAGRWRQVLSILQSDIPGVRAIDDRGVDTLARREAVLRRLIQQQGLAEHLEVRARDDRLVVRGTIPAADRVKWKLVVAAFDGSYGGLPPIEDHIGEAIPADIQLAIRSVNIHGEDAYVELQDGSKYLPGAQIANGYRLRAIGPDRLVLSRDGREYVYPFGRN